MKYMDLTTKQVEEEIKKVLPDDFAIVFDGWTCEETTTHYLAIAVAYLGKDGKRESVLLAFTPFEDESSFTAAAHKELLETTLNVYGKSLSNVICLVGDNCATNQRLAKECNLPLVGCAAHRFNLEVQKYLEKHAKLLQKVFSIVWTFLTFY